MSSIKSNLSLRNRIIGAGSWVLGGHVTSMVLRLGGNLIMTRLLVPEMFGVMAIANVFLAGLALFSDLGLRQNIIQSSRGDEREFLNTVWTIQIIRGGILWLMAIGLAVAVHQMSKIGIWASDSVYAAPLLPIALSAISFNTVINGFESTKLATANRDLSLGIITRIELTSQVAGLAVMIAWALVDRSIWALVAGSIAASLIRVLLSHSWIEGPMNRLFWDKAAFAEVFNFGKWIFLSSIIGFLVNSGDRLLLGGLVEARVLGIYVIAFFLANALQQVTSRIIGSVVYPALSELVRNPASDLRSAYYRIRLPIDFVTLLGAGFIFACGSVIIQVLYDDRYVTAGHMLEILSIGLIGIRYNVAGNLFMAMGKPHLLLPIILARLVSLYILLPLSYGWFGLDGALWIAGGSILFSLPVIFYLKVKYSIFDYISEIRVVPLLVIGYLLGLSLVYTHKLFLSS